MQRARVGRAFLQIALHRGIVDLDHLLDQLAVDVGNGQEVGLAGVVVEAVDHAAAGLRWQVDRQHLGAERFLQTRQQRLQVEVVLVDLVDDDQPAQVAGARRLHHPPRHQLDAGAGADHHHHGLDSVERAERLADEVRIARRVDQVNAHRVATGRVIAVDHAGAQRVQRSLLQRIEVADRAALLHAARGADHAALGEQLLDQHRLSCRAVADDGHGPQLLRAECVAGCHVLSLACCSFRPVRQRRPPPTVTGSLYDRATRERHPVRHGI